MNLKYTKIEGSNTCKSALFKYVSKKNRKKRKI